MGADLKIIAIGSSAYDPKCAPNPGFLGEVWNCYRGATLTQNNPRTNEK